MVIWWGRGKCYVVFMRVNREVRLELGFVRRIKMNLDEFIIGSFIMGWGKGNRMIILRFVRGLSRGSGDFGFF